LKVPHHGSETANQYDSLHPKDQPAVRDCLGEHDASPAQRDGPSLRITHACHPPHR
jgi:hypothetical protein